MAALPPVVNRKQVLSVLGWSKGTLENRIKDNEFPPPVPTGSRTRLWLESDVQDYLDARLAERDSALAELRAGQSSARHARAPKGASREA